MGVGSRTFGARERAEIIEAIERGAEQGRSVGATARDFGITGSVYYSWIRERARTDRGSAAPVPGSGPASRSRRRVSADEKERLVAEMRHRRDRGESIQAVALATGLHENTCYRWLRRPVMPAFRPVEVVVAEPAPPPRLSLTAPGGYRIEGLDVETAARLLRALE
ncbi:MAG: transposase [Candidatus Sericytochromatia bacterium]|nr:transposase [Candidatus Tanganyikabacteria bacterium]